MITGNEMAFPDPARGAEQNYSLQDPPGQPHGLTIRQHFAAIAMQGYLSNGPTRLSELSGVAMCSVAAADALIIELNKEK